ncbi:MAG: primosomal protein N', partial [Hyphomicrobiales bacterium]|nr:primosomal protein N' [Hyphomicrobiales bacterium]
MVADPPPTVADVLMPVAVDTAYSYRVPAGLAVAPGDHVRAQLGGRETDGVVWAVRTGGGDNLKPLLAKLDLAPIAEPLRRFVDWVAGWTLAPRGMVRRMAVRGATG